MTMKPRKWPRSSDDIAQLAKQFLALTEQDTKRFWKAVKAQADDPVREVALIHRHPTHEEIRAWANSALRNSEIDFLDEDFIRDFADGIPALMVKE